jgi:hypothetical protein
MNKTTTRDEEDPNLKIAERRARNKKGGGRGKEKEKGTKSEIGRKKIERDHRCG